VRGPLPGCPIVVPDHGLELAKKITPGHYAILSDPSAVFPQIQRLTGVFDFPSFISGPRDVDSANDFLSCMSKCAPWIEALNPLIDRRPHRVYVQSIEDAFLRAYDTYKTTASSTTHFPWLIHNPFSVLFYLYSYHFHSVSFPPSLKMGAPHSPCTMMPVYEAKDAAFQETFISSLLSSTTRTHSVSWTIAFVNSSEILKKDVR
jgi:hypothetical protein